MAYMSERTDEVMLLFQDKFACSQSVLAPFAEKYGLDKTLALRLACALGTGAKSGGVCGAVSGAGIVISLKYGHCSKEDLDGKKNCSDKMLEFVRIFRERNIYIDCRDILGTNINIPGERDKVLETIQERCPSMVRSAAEILEELGY